jgi:hypothetical protein
MFRNWCVWFSGWLAILSHHFDDRYTLETHISWNLRACTQVYKFFLVIYKVCFATATFGYCVVMADIFGLSLLLGDSLGSTGVLLLFYGLYFGVMGRDFAHEATERMANNIGAFWVYLH